MEVVTDYDVAITAISTCDALMVVDTHEYTPNKQRISVFNTTIKVILSQILHGHDIILGIYYKNAPYIDRHINNIQEILLLAIFDGGFIKSISSELNAYQNVVIAAVSKNGAALNWSSFKHDVDIVRLAISVNGNTLKYATDELKNNKDIVLAAVSKNGRALKYADVTLRSDRDILITAVNGGVPYKYIPKELLHDRNLILTMVHRDPTYIFQVDERFLDDGEIVCTTFSNKLNDIELWDWIYCSQHVLKHITFLRCLLVTYPKWEFTPYYTATLNLELPRAIVEDIASLLYKDLYKKYTTIEFQ